MTFRTNKSEFVPNAPAKVKICILFKRVNKNWQTQLRGFVVLLSIWDNSAPTGLIFVKFNTMND